MSVPLDLSQYLRNSIPRGSNPSSPLGLFLFHQCMRITMYRLVQPQRYVRRPPTELFHGLWIPYAILPQDLLRPTT